MLGQPIVNQLVLTNQFGEESINTVAGLLLTGAGAPVNGTTGDDVSPKGGLYVDITNGVLYVNTGTRTAPVWSRYGVQAAAQANSTAVDVAGIVADFNALLAKLRTAGLLAPNP